MNFLYILLFNYWLDWFDNQYHFCEFLPKCCWFIISIKWYFQHFCNKYQFQFYDNKIVVSFYSCLCISVDMDNLSQYCYVSLLLWIKIWFLSNYLLRNLSYKDDLLNSNVLWISSTYYCLIIGLSDLTINIIFVNFFLSVVAYYFI